MESMQGNTEDHLHAAQTTNKKDIYSAPLTPTPLSGPCPSFVRRDRQRTSPERNDFQVQRGGRITRESVPGQNNVVVRPRTSIGQTNATEGDELIAEEEAVCKHCSNNVLNEENILVTKCGCKKAFIHEACAANQSSCDYCGQDVQRFPVTLLRGLGSAQRIDTQESNKKSYFSWFWKCGF
ncbi:uncharacterized protein LOC130773504 isoform X1 [Actinidia eriantha]|uniref:uncharacterized protein LOC130773504 isoform X1 n=1 Tax=Actinidia eriantha TaxID=165200 RepID=UPI00258D31DB|nr:uncharacterized protein LOC130773504 isoform X1 [Actinidia eriantha]